VDFFSRFVEQSPAVSVHIASAYVQMGKPGKAEAFLKQALAVEPTSCMLNLELSSVYCEWFCVCVCVPFVYMCAFLLRMYVCSFCVCMCVPDVMGEVLLFRACAYLCVYTYVCNPVSVTYIGSEYKA
jgi:hypothetical protein